MNKEPQKFDKALTDAIAQGLMFSRVNGLDENETIAALAAELQPLLRECICKGNWRLLVSKEEKRFGSQFKKGDELWTFMGILHAEDDYYYLMLRAGTGVAAMLSCVGSIEGHGYVPVTAAQPSTPASQSDTPSSSEGGYHHSERELGRLLGRLEQLDRIKNERPIDPIYWDMHERRNLEEALAAKRMPLAISSEKHDGYRISNAIALAKSAIGDCADEVPHGLISAKLWTLVKMLYKILDAIVNQQSQPSTPASEKP